MTPPTPSELHTMEANLLTALTPNAPFDVREQARLDLARLVQVVRALPAPVIATWVVIPASAQSAPGMALQVDGRTLARYLHGARLPNDTQETWWAWVSGQLNKPFGSEGAARAHIATWADKKGWVVRDAETPSPEEPHAD